MRKNVIEQMKEKNAEHRIAMFKVKQKQDYNFKVRYAELRAREFVRECEKRNLNYHVSVGGLDSITLLLFLRKLGIRAPAISCSYLEDKSIQKIHRQLGVESLSPAKKADGTSWTKVSILQEFGFPVISKETARKIDLLQRPTERNTTVRHAIITGETGEYGGNRTGTRMKLAQKWLELFAGYENEREKVKYKIAPFKVSDKCCYYLKEKPCKDWAEKHNSVPFLGLMASEGGRREKTLMMNGCNYFGKSTIRSCPFAIFTRQDILELALELEVPVPEIYGEIARKEDGTLYTTKAQRTGCSMCGFGIHLEKRPHRFDQLYIRNPEEWQFWMKKCCKDKDGETYGWSRILDYIGVEWQPETMPVQFEQMRLPMDQLHQ